MHPSITASPASLRAVASRLPIALVGLLTTLLPATAPAGETWWADFAAARARLERGDFAEARERFGRLAETTDPERRLLAWFGLGNTNVRAATAADTGRERARRQLADAITAYRAALDAAERLPTLPPELTADLRHNLELAKRLRLALPRGDAEEDGASPSPPGTTGDQPTPAGGAPRERTVTLDERDSPAVPPPGVPTQEDAGGPITKARAGSGWDDPGPLSPQAARRRLAGVVERAANLPAAGATFPLRPVGRDDY